MLHCDVYVLLNLYVAGFLLESGKQRSITVQYEHWLRQRFFRGGDLPGGLHLRNLGNCRNNQVW